MKKFVVTLVLLLSAAAALSQERAAVQMENPNTHFHPGDPIAFRVKLNEPLPEGAYFQLRISPKKADQQVSLSSAEPADASRTAFIVRGTLPKAAIAGEWRLSVVYLFLSGTSWTSNTIQPNPVTFVVEGKDFPIPTTAEVTVTK